MSNAIGILNYGSAGNIFSIKNALMHIGADVKIIDNSNELELVDKLVLPGVGCFYTVMQDIVAKNLREPLQNAISQKPTLGICLGMQLLSTIGFENGKSEGLNFINAEVKPMQVDGKVPHMGFNSLQIVKPSDLLLGIEEEEFYFMHSYEVVNYTDILSLSSYSNHKFVSSVQKEHIFGVQFHPEKSREAGLELFKNFNNM